MFSEHRDVGVSFFTQLRNGIRETDDIREELAEASVVYLEVPFGVVVAAVKRAYPERMVAQVVRNSNGLMTMAGMLLALLGADDAARTRMSKIQPEFADCLPPLLSRASP